MTSFKRALAAPESPHIPHAVDHQTAYNPTWLGKPRDVDYGLETLGVPRGKLPPRGRGPRWCGDERRDFRLALEMFLAARVWITALSELDREVLEALREDIRSERFGISEDLRSHGETIARLDPIACVARLNGVRFDRVDTLVLPATASDITTLREVSATLLTVGTSKLDPELWCLALATLGTDEVATVILSL